MQLSPCIPCSPGSVRKQNQVAASAFNADAISFPIGVRHTSSGAFSGALSRPPDSNDQIRETTDLYLDLEVTRSSISILTDYLLPVQKVRKFFRAVLYYSGEHVSRNSRSLAFNTFRARSRLYSLGYV